MRELTFITLLIFLTRSSHSHSIHVNQQYIDNVMQRRIMQHIVSYQRMSCIIQSRNNVTDFSLFASFLLPSTCLFWADSVHGEGKWKGNVIAANIQ